MKTLAIVLLSCSSSVVFADDVNAATSTSTSLDALEQMNQVSSFHYANPKVDWTKYVTMHGGAFVDGHWGSLDEAKAGVDSNRESVTNSYLAAEIDPTDWVKINGVLNYSNASSTYVAGQDTGTNIDQAYGTIGNLNKFPVYLEGGKQYLPFGSYDLYPITKSFTQLLSETNDTDAQVGFALSQGIYGDLYTFEGPTKDSSDQTDDTVGVTLGFKHDINSKVHMNLEVGFIDNFQEVGLVADYLADNNSGQFGDRVNAYSVHGDLNAGPIEFVGSFITASSDTSDIQNNGENMKPSAHDYTLNYNFMAKGIGNQVFVGYEESADSNELDLPEYRYELGYNVHPLKNTVFGLELTKDTNYDSSDGGDGEDYYTIGLRAGLQF